MHRTSAGSMPIPADSQRHIAIMALGLFLMTAMPGRCWPSDARPGDTSQTDLTQLSLEELMNIEVTSVAKKPQRLAAAAAAIFVITHEDIRRSGATSLPEALRMVPGLQVARIDANKWAITARGFNGRFANKLLVLIDGRSVYTPSFSGVYWEVQDTLLEDVERIEVIRGPGATLWGANAVNGIINIMTKHAQDTQGGLITAGGGTEERGFGGVRYGTTLGEDAHVRLYVKYFNRDDFVDTSGNNTDDAWHMLRGGFRLDWQVLDRHALTVQGDLYGGDASQNLTLPTLTPPFVMLIDDDIDLLGGNVLTRWQHTVAASSELTLQLYYDRTEREEKAIFRETRDTIDLDFQHRFALGQRQEIVWGLGYRYTHDHISESFFLAIDPDSRGDNLFSAFVQDEITLVPDRLRLTLGSKFEHNDHTGFEFQPNARFLWTPHARHAVWAAVSRAVRTPSRAEDDVRFNFAVLPPNTPLRNPSALPAVVTVEGNRDFDSEVMLAYELGYRVRPLERLSLDIAAFFTDYDNLRTGEPGSPVFSTSPLPPHLVLPNVLQNRMHGESHGVEVAVDWRPMDWWRLHLAYTYLQLHLRIDRDSQNPTAEEAAGQSPHHQVSFRSAMSLPWDLEFDVWLRYIDELPTLDVDRYVTLDLRLAWKPVKRLELALVGQNLLEGRHLEFRQELFPVPTAVQRSVYGKITWQF